MQLLGILEEEQQLCVVHLQHHSRDLARHVRRHLQDARVNALPKHLLLHPGRRCREIRRRDSRQAGARRTARPRTGGAHARARAARAALAHHAAAHHAHAGRTLPHHHGVHHHGVHRTHAHASRHAHAHAGAIGPAAHAAAHAIPSLAESLAPSALLIGTEESLARHMSVERLAAVPLLQPPLPLGAALGEADVERLLLDHLQVHLAHGLGGLLGGGERHEAETFVLSVVVARQACTAHVSEGIKKTLQLLFSHVVGQVLDVQSDALFPAIILLNFLLALLFRLRPADVELHELRLLVPVCVIFLLLALGVRGFFVLFIFFGGHALKLVAVKLLNSRRRRFRGLVVYERERAAELVRHENAARHLAQRREELEKLLLSVVGGKHLDVEVRALTLRSILHVHGHRNHAVANLHIVDARDGRLRSLLRLKMHESVPSRFTLLI